MKTNPIFAILGLGLTFLLTACPLTPAPPAPAPETPEDGAPTPSFTISIEPTSFTVEQPSKVTATLTITPLNGFAGTVYLDMVQSESGKPPSGFVFSPISVDVPGPDSVTVPFTIVVGSNASLGTYSLEVRGTSGRITKGANFTITVNPPSGEGEENGEGGSTVRIVQLDNMPLMGAYYRTGNDPWRPLNFTYRRATFTASGDYEVAVRCDLSDLHLFKANLARTPKIIFSCAEPDRSATFYVYLPEEIGRTPILLSDLVGVSDSLVGYPGFNPMVVGGKVLSGQWDLLFTVISSPDNPFSPSPGSFAPIGYKLANVTVANHYGGVVDDTDWHPFSGVRTFTLTPPPGFEGGGGSVSFFKDGMAVPTVTGIGGSYGTLPIPGKYIGLACAYNSNFDESLFAMKDTSGLDWDARFPNPWASGQFAVNRNTLVFNYPQAQAYLFSATGIVENTATEEPYMRVIVHLFEGGNTSYTLPEVPGLSYRLADFHTRNVQFTLKAFQGHAFPLQGLIKDSPSCFVAQVLYSLVHPADLSEEALAGLDLSWVERWGMFSGNSYTLP